MSIKKKSYEERLAVQVEQYRQVDNIHDLPDIFHYWSNKYVRPRLNEVIGADSVTDFYALQFSPLLKDLKSPRQILSVGSGDCSVEIEVIKKLLDLGHEDFELTCLEVSSHLLEKAEKTVKKENLEKFFVLEQVDINKWQPCEKFVGVMANHSLHHFVELEDIFSGIHQCLDDNGVFVSNDMIGRNGHMRWPEVLELVAGIWDFMPDRYKFNRQLDRFDSQFVNWDCSNEGFEGVRAQDILPLLVEKFGFISFLSFGGIVDIFVDRAFGHNLDPGSLKDRAFVDFLQLLDDRLIDIGQIKPTTMFAVMGKHKSIKTSCWRKWSPEFCVRDICAT